jgi:hypothetical protein
VSLVTTSICLRNIIAEPELNSTAAHAVLPRPQVGVTRCDDVNLHAHDAHVLDGGLGGFAGDGDGGVSRGVPSTCTSKANAMVRLKQIKTAFMRAVVTASNYSKPLQWGRNTDDDNSPKPTQPQASQRGSTQQSS